MVLMSTATPPSSRATSTTSASSTPTTTLIAGGASSSSSPTSSSSSTTGNSFFPSTMITIRTACLGAAFVFLILQLHVTYDKLLYHDASGGVQGLLSCQEDRSHEPPPLLLRAETETTTERDHHRTAVEDHRMMELMASTTSNNSKQPKALPSITDQGMIIIFLHIPKTGGTTMSEPFVHSPEWRYRMVYGPRKQANYSLEMTTTIKEWQPGTKIFYEYHGGRSAPYMDWSVRDDLQTWRAMAKIRKIPFFAFTVFREPLSFAVSHFNFYYANRQKDDNRYYYVPDPTEQDFVQLSLPNPQCLFCVSSEVAYYKEWRQDKHKTIHVPRQGCEAVYEAFCQDLDWIGTTELLSTQTFPMIEQIANVRFVSHLKNKSKDKIKKSNLTQSALSHIRNITSYDNDIYQRIQLDFPIDMWSNFHHHGRQQYQEQQQPAAAATSVVEVVAGA